MYKARKLEAVLFDAGGSSLLTQADRASGVLVHRPPLSSAPLGWHHILIWDHVSLEVSGSACPSWSPAMHLLGDRRKDGRGKEAEVEEMREESTSMLLMVNYAFLIIILEP